jgi:hypothetical protein
MYKKRRFSTTLDAHKNISLAEVEEISASKIRQVHHNALRNPQKNYSHLILLQLALQNF